MKICYDVVSMNVGRRSAGNVSCCFASRASSSQDELCTAVLLVDAKVAERLCCVVAFHSFHSQNSLLDGWPSTVGDRFVSSRSVDLHTDGNQVCHTRQHEAIVVEATADADNGRKGYVSADAVKTACVQESLVLAITVEAVAVDYVYIRGPAPNDAVHLRTVAAAVTSIRIE